MNLESSMTMFYANNGYRTLILKINFPYIRCRRGLGNIPVHLLKVLIWSRRLPVIMAKVLLRRYFLISSSPHLISFVDLFLESSKRHDWAVLLLAISTWKNELLSFNYIIRRQKKIPNFLSRSPLTSSLLIKSIVSLSKYPNSTWIFRERLR